MPVFLVQVKKGQGAAMRDWRMTYNQKQIAALRLWYRGGYSGYFVQQVRRMISQGLTPEELLAASVDDRMRKWIEDALPKVPQRD